jgi:hypothetical protein
LQLVFSALEGGLDIGRVHSLLAHYFCETKGFIMSKTIKNLATLFFLGSTILGPTSLFAKTYKCTDQKDWNFFVGHFLLTATADGIKIDSVELSSQTLAGISSNEILSLRNLGHPSDYTKKMIDNAVAFNFDFTGEPEPYEHAPVKYKGYSRYKVQTPKNVDVFRRSELGDLAHIVVRPEIIAGTAFEENKKLGDVVFQYAQRESGAAEYFSCY